MTESQAKTTLQARLAELEADQDRQHNFFQTTSQGIIYQNAAGEIIDANPAAEEILGLTRDQLGGRLPQDPRWQAQHEDGSPFPGAQHPSMQALATGKEIRDAVMKVYNPKDEKYRWIKIQAIPHFRPGEDTPYQVYTAFEDITAQKESEQALKANEARLRALINATPDIICFKDGEGRWLEANQADLELFELTAVDYRGKTDRELAEFSPFYCDAFLTCEESDEAAWQAEGLSRGDEIIPIPTGGERVFDVIKVPIFSADGSRQGLVVLGRDITERVQAQKELEKHRTHLEELVEKRTAELKKLVNAMAGREVRMAELKETIRKLRRQIKTAGMEPIADDPLKNGLKVEG